MVVLLVRVFASSDGTRVNLHGTVLTTPESSADGDRWIVEVELQEAVSGYYLALVAFDSGAVTCESGNAAPDVSGVTYGMRIEFDRTDGGFDLTDPITIAAYNVTLDC